MILVAENLTVTDAGVSRALERHDPAPLRRVAALAAAAGARYLDVNLGPGALGGPDSVEFVLEALVGHWSGGVLVDTTNPAVMERAARRATAASPPLVLNGYSGDDGREAVLDVASRFGLPVVVFLMARGVPRSAEERLALAAELVGRCQERGVGLDRIWIDPVVAPLGWADGQDRDAALLEVLRRLPELFGEPVTSIVGVSNLTTGAVGVRRLPWLEEVFLALAAGAGLTHAMVDVRNVRLMRVARALEVLDGHRLFAPNEFEPHGGRPGT
ncbi:MAG: dihydropteroate synthase [Deltaproteobacteria bacterium]|nr:dihydropteroate synthase [Deltaproteobacteria bacterium]